MSDNGSGAYNVNSAGQPVVTDTPITAAAFNAYTADAATAMSNRIAKDGQTTVTANIPLAGYKLTGVGAATARTDAATLAVIQDGIGVYSSTVGGTADAITITPSPVITAYVAGMGFQWIASGANTGAVTLAVNGLAAKAVTRNGTTALLAGDIASGSMVTATYDGTRFILASSSALALSGGNLTGGINHAKTTVASAATPDIFATTVGNYIDYTGTVTTTGFVAAPQAGVWRHLHLTGAAPFTAGANLLIPGTPSGSTYTCEANDIVAVYAKTPTLFELRIEKADGTPASFIIPQNSKSTAYTTVLSDAGKHLLHPSADTTARTFTIDSNANVPYPIGTAITFVNQASAGVMTIAVTTDTMRLAGAGTTGSRTLAANGIATALKIVSTEWLISGTGLT